MIIGSKRLFSALDSWEVAASISSGMPVKSSTSTSSRSSPRDASR